MILNTGSRTDIPAYYSAWFENRIKEGYVMARNPYNPKRIIRYSLSPEVVDCLVFCTKNPYPMLSRMDVLKPYRQFWFVTITPYAKDIEPGVPDKHQVLQSFQALSRIVGKEKIAWRYDPIFISERYTMEYHKRAFKSIAEALDGYTEQCVISFIDLYEKTKKNFPEVREVTQSQMEELAQYCKQITDEHGMILRTCLENHGLDRYGIDIGGCMTQQVLEKAEDFRLKISPGVMTREGCRCLLGNDIGMYNTCGHGCRYCYANYDMRLVLENMKKHDPSSPLLIGHPEADDVITDAVQKSWIERQMVLEL